MRRHLSAFPTMVRRTKLHSEFNFCGLVASLTAVARALREECCMYAPGCIAACTPAVSETASGIWWYLSDTQLPPCFRMEMTRQGITPVLFRAVSAAWCRAGSAQGTMSIHPPVPGREGTLSPLAPRHGDPQSDTMQQVKDFLPLPQTLLLLIPTLLPCQQEEKPAGFAFKVPSFPWSHTARLQSQDISSGWGLGKQFYPQPTDISLLPEPALGATLWLGPSLLFQTPVSYIWVRFNSSSWPKSFLTQLFEITVSVPDSCPSAPPARDRK